MRLNQAGRRRGTAAVELAVSAMPLMIIVMGIFEGGRLMMVEEQLTNAAREGARLASVAGSTIGTSSGTGAMEVSYRVREYLTASQLDASAATIAVTDLDDGTITDLPQANVGDRIRVSVSIPFKNVAWITPWFFGSSTLSASCIMRKESL